MPKLNIKAKLTALFLACGIVPLAAVGFVALRNADEALDSSSSLATKALEQQTTGRLVAARDLKKAGVEYYFAQVTAHLRSFASDLRTLHAMRELPGHFAAFRAENAIDDAKLAALEGELTQYHQGQFGAEYARRNEGRRVPLTPMQSMDADTRALQAIYITHNPNLLGQKHLWDRADDVSSYSTLHAEFHPGARSLVEQFGFYDVFLVDGKGDVVYTCFKELDFASSLVDGPWARSGLGEAYRAASTASAGSVALTDYAQYTPSYEDPASFIATPIFAGDERLGVLIFQLPLDRVSAVMDNRAGLGETFEAYLVGRDKLMRSNSFRDPEHRSVAASFRHPEQGRVETEAVSQALGGKSGSGETGNYAGERVLACWSPLEIHGLAWALVAEAGTSEIYAGLREMEASSDAAQRHLLSWTVGVAGVSALLVAILGLFLGERIARPLRRTEAGLAELARGNLQIALEVDRSDELGRMSSAFNAAVVGMNGVLERVKGTAARLVSAGQDLRMLSTAMSNEAEEASNAVTQAQSAVASVTENAQSVSAGVEEMSAAICEISKSASLASNVANETVRCTAGATDTVNRLGTSSRNIDKVIRVITSIAEQTNLLALNATIEAARAGESGRGFAVVATEVKELARQTAVSSDEISTSVESVLTDTQSAVSAIAQVTEIVNRIAESQTGIAAAVEEQTVTTNEMSSGITMIAQRVGEIATGISLAAEASNKTAAGATEMRSAAEQLDSVAAELQTLLLQYRTGQASESGSPARSLQGSST
jgi:methyl-accepting chemotaxis protein